MAEKEILTSMLLRPGIKAIITNEQASSTYPAGSIGYSSAIHMPHIGTLQCRQTMFIIRRGKSGKTRLEAKKFTVPIYLINDNTYKEHLQNGKCCVTFRQVPDAPSNLIEMPTLEFLAWAGAYVLYLKYLTRIADYSPNIWPKGRNHIFNIFLQICSHYEDRQDDWLTTYGGLSSRNVLIAQIRSFEAQVYKCGCKYVKSISGIKRHALNIMLQLITAKTLPIKQKTINNTIKIMEQEAQRNV